MPLLKSQLRLAAVDGVELPARPPVLITLPTRRRLNLAKPCYGLAPDQWAALDRLMRLKHGAAPAIVAMQPTRLALSIRRWSRVLPALNWNRA